MDSNNLPSKSQQQTNAKDPLNRFSNRVADYVKYRPGYPDEIVEFLKQHCGLTREALVADIGSGTGILSQLFLKNGNTVFGVEPNAAMRKAGEEQLDGWETFHSVAGTAEFTTLEASSFDFITAAQAFHWFNQEPARAEFNRILKPYGWLILIWNERRLSSTAFLRDYEQLLIEYGTDYGQVRHENVEQEISTFYKPAACHVVSFENFQSLDVHGLTGRCFSASYTPQPGHPGYESMVKDLRSVFAVHQVHGMVTIEYDTKLYYGHLRF